MKIYKECKNLKIKLIYEYISFLIKDAYEEADKKDLDAEYNLILESTLQELQDAIANGLNHGADESGIDAYFSCTIEYRDEEENLKGTSQ